MIPFSHNADGGTHVCGAPCQKRVLDLSKLQQYSGILSHPFKPPSAFQLQQAGLGPSHPATSCWKFVKSSISVYPTMYRSVAAPISKLVARRPPL